MVHGAGIQVAVIRELSSRITACLECGNSSQMHIEMWTACMCVCVSVMLSAPAVVVHGLVKVAVICCQHLSYHSLLWLVCDHSNSAHVTQFWTHAGT